MQSKGAAIEWVRRNKEWQRSIERGELSTLTSVVYDDGDDVNDGGGDGGGGSSR